MYISYAMFHERVHVVAGRSSVSLFQAVGDEDTRLKAREKLAEREKWKTEGKESL